MPLASFPQRKPHRTPGSSGVLVDLAEIDKDFQKLGSPSSAFLGKGKPV